MIVVSDTGPLNYLLLICQIELLPKLFGRVIAPEAVLQEMLHPSSPLVVREWAGAPPAWLESAKPISDIRLSNLEIGEAEAIALAQELNADLLLVDDRRAKQTALGYHLRVLGTLGALELAAQQHLVSLESTIDALRQTNFHRPEKLIEEILRRNRSK